MRGSDERSGELFSYVDLEKRVRLDHPLRAIRVLTDSALEARRLSAKHVFCTQFAARFLSERTPDGLTLMRSC